MMGLIKLLFVEEREFRTKEEKSSAWPSNEQSYTNINKLLFVLRQRTLRKNLLIS